MIMMMWRRRKKKMKKSGLQALQFIHYNHLGILIKQNKGNTIDINILKKI